MNFEKAIREIEAPELSARLNVASDFRTFLRAAQQEEALRILLEGLNSKENLAKVILRVVELSQKETDPNYENPWDTALAVFLWAVNQKYPDLATALAKIVMRAPECWWVWKMARIVGLEKQVYSNAGQRDYKLFSSESALPTLTRTTDTG